MWFCQAVFLGFVSVYFFSPAVQSFLFLCLLKRAFFLAKGARHSQVGKAPMKRQVARRGSAVGITTISLHLSLLLAVHSIARPADLATHTLATTQTQTRTRAPLPRHRSERTDQPPRRPFRR